MQRAGRHTFSQSMKVRADTGKNATAAKMARFNEGQDRRFFAQSILGEIDSLYNRMPRSDARRIKGRLAHGERISNTDLKALRHAYYATRGVKAPDSWGKMLMI